MQQTYDKGEALSTDKSCVIKFLQKPNGKDNAPPSPLHPLILNHMESECKPHRTQTGRHHTSQQGHTSCTPKP